MTSSHVLSHGFSCKVEGGVWISELVHRLVGGARYFFAFKDAS